MDPDSYSLIPPHLSTPPGIGSIREGVHPLQRRIAELHGSQCGFCTPGIVMAMYTLFRQHPDAAAEFIEENMDGNLCRCVLAWLCFWFWGSALLCLCGWVGR